MLWSPTFCRNDVVPVVLGAQKTDYLAAAPANSFIHIEDFASVETLAQYLQLLNSDDDLYNQYFQWKGSGHFINTKFWCRLCSMLHTVDKEGGVMWYPDVEAWWRSDGICTKGRWDDPSSLIRDWGTVYWWDSCIPWVNCLWGLWLILYPRLQIILPHIMLP